MRVLLVDDYPDALEVWDLFLSTSGCDVLTAGDGRIAVELARARRPDVIVMDIQMPGLSGPATAEILRADPTTRHIPLIAVTGRRIDPADVARLGFAALIVKPCEPEELLAAIRRVAVVGEAPAGVARPPVY